MDSEQSRFIDAGARAQYYLICAITFLAFLSVSATVYLPVLMRSQGLSPTQIGVVMAAIGPPMLIANLGGGMFIERFGAGKLAAIALITIALSIVGLQLWPGSFGAMVACRVVLGVGVGLFTPSAMVCARNTLATSDDYLFGIFTVMFTLPTVVGPSAAEAALNPTTTGYFYTLASAAALAALMALGLRNIHDGQPATSPDTYRNLLSRPDLRQPLLYTVASSLLFGFPPAFMALVLHDKGVPAAYFFASWTFTLVLTRFAIATKLQRFERFPLLVTALFAMSACMLLLLSGPSRAYVAIAGVAFGIGHAIAQPLITLWVTDSFPAAARGKPLALLSAVSNLAIYTTPLVGGLIVQLAGMDALIGLLATAGTLAMAAAARSALGRNEATDRSAA